MYGRLTLPFPGVNRSLFNPFWRVIRRNSGWRRFVVAPRALAIPIVDTQPSTRLRRHFHRNCSSVSAPLHSRTLALRHASPGSDIRALLGGVSGTYRTSRGFWQGKCRSRRTCLPPRNREQEDRASSAWAFGITSTTTGFRRERPGSMSPRSCASRSSRRLSAGEPTLISASRPSPRTQPPSQTTFAPRGGSPYWRRRASPC